MKKIYFYFHAGSGNHGCEAIVRSTQRLLNKKPVLVSAAPDEDFRYHIDQITEVKESPVLAYSFFEKVLCIITSRFLKSENYGYKLKSKYESREFEKESIALSIGGDNYCYGEAYNLYLAAMNHSLHQRGIKTVLWGCSIEPEQVTDSMRKDFAKYDLIVARESISYCTLKECNPNTILVSDPAFSLETVESPLPGNFVKGKTVGINISPLIQKSENKSGITYANYQRLIAHILENTEYNIALIPHVVCEENDDRIPLRELFSEFKNSGRICMIEDCNCEKLKGYISKCCLFVGARTHATIAAYSSYVPTLVIGYSTKATGIAKDLFGSAENYVLPVQQLAKEDDIVKAFIWLEEHGELIRKRLSEIIPEYTAKIQNAIQKIEEL